MLQPIMPMLSAWTMIGIKAHYSITFSIGLINFNPILFLTELSYNIGMKRETIIIPIESYTTTAQALFRKGFGIVKKQFTSQGWKVTIVNFIER